MSKLLFLTLLTFLLSCSSQIPKDIIPPDKMKVVLFDMIRADEFLNNYVFNDTSLNKKQETTLMYEQVFKIHKTNKEQFYKSYIYYQQNPDKNKALYDSVNSYATRKKQVPLPAKKPLKEVK
ncbi:MAG: hypothetical protein JWQ96_1728 [Segetibacter sp.]|jgi:hypothetical protein|nr:hypothetical protein [Segetibacter sp.]